MGKQWIVVEKATGRIKSRMRSSSDNPLPADTAELQYIEDPDGKIADAHREKQAQLQAERRKASDMFWDGSKIDLKTDSRTIMEITADRAPDARAGAILMDANGVDSVELTFTVKVSEGGVTDTSVQGKRTFTMDARRQRDVDLSVTFVNGVGVKPFTTEQADRFVLQAYKDVKVTTPPIEILSTV